MGFLMPSLMRPGAWRLRYDRFLAIVRAHFSLVLYFSVRDWVLLCQQALFAVMEIRKFI